LNYIFGVFVVSGGVVLEVSLAAVSVVVVVVTVVESVVVLSEEPDTFFVELHAEAANIIEPAKARLKIVFFIMSFISSFKSTNSFPLCFIFVTTQKKPCYLHSRAF
jgi:hypothetical protein